MTKDTYFEMCDMLGTDPVDDEIPLELSDFPELVQQVFNIYQMLADNWDTMSGTYLGKDYSLVFRLLEVYGITCNHEQLIAFDILKSLDSTRKSIISEKKPAT